MVTGWRGGVSACFGFTVHCLSGLPLLGAEGSNGFNNSNILLCTGGAVSSKRRLRTLAEAGQVPLARSQGVPSVTLFLRRAAGGIQSR